VYIKAPARQDRRCRKKMASQRNKVAKQSLKHRRTKMLWSRFERIKSGKT
jgi:hypothetical protein